LKRIPKNMKKLSAIYRFMVLTITGFFRNWEMMYLLYLKRKK